MNLQQVNKPILYPRRGMTIHETAAFILGLLGLLLVVDQMLLPMFHPFGVSFKPSYLLLVLFPFFVATLPPVADRVGMRRRFWTLAGPILWIAFFGFLGQLYLLVTAGIFDPEALFKQMMTYALMVLALYFGQHVAGFRLRSILWVLYGSIAIVLLLSLAADRVPWLAQLWWKSEDVIAYRLEQNQLRPTPFGDGSMVGTGLLFLFVVVSVRLRFLNIEKYHVAIATVLVTVTAVVLVSRNQIVAVMIMGFALLLSGSGPQRRKLLFMATFVAGVVVTAMFFGDTIRNNVPTLDRAITRLEREDYLDIQGQERQSETLLRPLLNWERFVNRFTVSPLWGTGFSIGDIEPFVRLNFHNDWFHVWATSGALGGIALFVWMFRIYKELGLLVLLPFFLPGLTNSFLLHVAGVIFYCFMIGVLVERKHLVTAKGAQGSDTGNVHASGRAGRRPLLTRRISNTVRL